MKRKPVEGEIIVTDWDLMGKWYDAVVMNGEYQVFTMNGRVGYDSVANTANDRVVISHVATTPNGGAYEVIRWLKRGQKVRLVPVSKQS